jgi:hypothetical protein
MNFRLILAALIWVFALFLISCAKPQVSESRAVFVTIKTPKILISQAGFIDTIEDGYRLQIYAAGSPVEELRVAKNICKGILCMSAEKFNADFLSADYPPTLLLDILSARAATGLMNSGVAPLKNGFSQRAVTAKYDIIYEKTAGLQTFADRLNKITIVLRDSE